MTDSYAEQLIGQMTRLDGLAKPLPRWWLAKREASFAILRRFLKTAPPSTIHHYTSSTALISIVTNNELWLSDATFLNDRHEIELGRRLACSRLSARAAAKGSPDFRQVIERTLEKFEQKTDPQVYVACFSFEGDDLTQWRAYGGTDAPVVIEFEHGPTMFGYTSEGLFDQVLYDPEDQQWVFDQLLAAYADAYSEDVRDPIPFERRGPPLTREEECEMVADSLYHALWRYIVTCKDPAFIAEREARFIYTAHDYSQAGKSWHPEHPLPRFRERSGRIIPFLVSNDLDFNNLDRIGDVPKLPICSVRVGPTAEPSLIERGIRRLLDAHGHEAAVVTVSNSPFRPR